MSDPLDATLSCVFTFHSPHATSLWLLIDPVELGGLVRLNLLGLEPQGDLLLGTLDTVGAVADVATDIDGVVAANGTWGRGQRVGSTEDGCRS
jgi:hypothetical protein